MHEMYNMPFLYMYLKKKITAISCGIKGIKTLKVMRLQENNQPQGCNSTVSFELDHITPPRS